MRAVKQICLWLMSIVLLLSGLSCAVGPSPYEQPENGGIVYKQTDKGELVLDLLYPTRRLYESNPTVLVFHGGGWISGSKEEFLTGFSPLVTALRQSGITVAAVEYRYAGSGLTWRDCLDDCEDALRFLIDHADRYDVDTDRIGVIGYSAGAHLALMTAIESGDAVRHCTALSAPAVFVTDPGSPFYSTSLDYYMDWIFTDCSSRTALQEASPTVKVNRRCTASFLLICGSEDSVVPSAHSEAFAKEAGSFGLDAKLMKVEGMTHSYAAYRGLDELCRTAAEAIADSLGTE